MEPAFAAVEEALARLGALSAQEHFANADDLEALSQQKSHWGKELSTRFAQVLEVLRAQGHEGTLIQLASKAKSPDLKARILYLLDGIRQAQGTNAVSREIVQRKLNASRALAQTLMALQSEQPVLADAPSGIKQFSGLSASRRTIGQA
jgi:hypothetical protein